MQRYFLLFSILFFTASCVSTKNTIKNIDDNAKMPALNKDKAFVITEYSADKKYGYNQDYPINLGFYGAKTAEINVKRFFDALEAPNGEKIIYKKLDSCCPFPSKRDEMGAGILDIYEVKWQGQKSSLLLYINLYERGKIMAPVGFAIKKMNIY